MHLWRATFRVGDFQTKQLTVTTAERGYVGVHDADEAPCGGFAEAEHLAMKAAESETNGWPSPIDLVALEYIDEISPPPAETAPAKPRRRPNV